MAQGRGTPPTAIRRLKSAAAVTIVVGVLFSVQVYVDAKPYFLEVAARSDADGAMTLYWNVGRSFNEADSLSLPVVHGRGLQVYRFPLPESSIRKLRLDPLNARGTVEIEAIRLTGDGGAVLRAITPEQVRAAGDAAIVGRTAIGFVVTCSGEDPQLLLDIDYPLRNRPMIGLSRSPVYPLAVLAGIFLLSWVFV